MFPPRAGGEGEGGPAFAESVIELTLIIRTVLFTLHVAHAVVRLSCSEERRTLEELTRERERKREREREREREERGVFKPVRERCSGDSSGPQSIN